MLLGAEPHAATGCRRRRAARARGRRRRRRGAAPRSTSGWQVDDGDGELASGAARRRLHPVAGAHVARLPRTGARRARGAVPRRDELARLRQPRSPRPAHGAARDRRPERRARARHRAAVVAVRLRRRRPASSSTSSTAAGGTSAPRRPSRCRPTIRSRDAMRYPRRAARGRAPGSTPSELLERIVRDRHVLEVGALDGVGSATSRAACASSSTRPARSATPPAARCATTSRGPSCRARKARASSRPSCPRPTTTPSAS